MSYSVSRIVLRVLLLSAAATAIVSTVVPELDLAIAGLFFDSATLKFPAATNPQLNWLRDHGLISIVSCLGCAAAALVAKIMLPERSLVVPGRAVLFLAITLSLGPGVLVNGVFKEHWPRPRPNEIADFTGQERYVAWWDLRGTCERNCSFVSGEAATAAWMFAPAILVPAPWRAAALGAAAVFTVTMSVMRMAFGAHFFTDVAFGIVMTLLVLWTVHGLIFRWPRTALNESAIDRAISGFARAVQRTVASLVRRRRSRPSQPAIAETL